MTHSELIVLWADDIPLARMKMIRSAVTKAAGDRPIVFTQDLAQLQNAAQALVVFRDPTLSLARRITAEGAAESAAEGTTEGAVDPALANWRDWAKALIAAVSKNRDKVTLLDDASFFDPEMPHATILTERAGLLGLEVLTPPTADVQPEPMAMLAAFGLLAHDPQAQTLVGELRALTPNHPALSSEVVAQALADARDQKSDQARQIEHLNAELQTLRAAAANTALLVEAAALNSRLLDNASTSMGGLRRKNRLLAKRQVDCDMLAAEVWSLKQELARVYSSKSWKVTGMMRAMRSKILRG